MRTFAVVLLVSALFGSTAAISVREQQRSSTKLDPVLIEAVKQGGNTPVRAVVQLQPGARESFVSHLRQHGLNPMRLLTANLIAVELPASMLRRVAADRDVVRLSADPVVQGVQGSLVTK